MDRVDTHQGEIADAVADARIAYLRPVFFVADRIGRVQTNVAETGDAGIARSEVTVAMPLGAHDQLDLIACRTIKALTRENLLKQATSLKDVQPPLFLDGIKVSNSPTDYRAIHNLQVTRFDGANWIPVGSMVDLDGIAS